MSSLLPPSRIRSSSAPRRRGWLGPAAAAALGGALATGCGAGFNAASLVVKPNAGAAQDGSLKINNVWVVVDPSTGNAEVLGAIANTGTSADKLVSVKAGGLPATIRPAVSAAVASALPLDGVVVSGDAVTIGRGASVSFGQPGRPELEITGGSFSPGRLTQVSLEFASAGPVTINAQIMPNTGLFAEYDPNGPNLTSGSTSNPSASPTPSPSPSASPSPSPS